MKNKYTIEGRENDSQNWFAYSEPNKKEALRFVKEVMQDKSTPATISIRVRRNGWIIASWTRNIPGGVFHNSLLWIPIPK